MKRLSMPFGALFVYSFLVCSCGRPLGAGRLGETSDIDDLPPVTEVIEVPAEKLVFPPVKELPAGYETVFSCVTGNCSLDLNGREAAYDLYLYPGEFQALPRPLLSSEQRWARVIAFELGNLRIAKKSNKTVISFAKEYFKNTHHYSEQQLASFDKAWPEVERLLATVQDPEAPLDPHPEMVGMPSETPADGSNPEYSRVLFNSNELRSFGSGSPLEGRYTEAELYDKLKSISNVPFVPENGLIVAIQDFVDGAPYHGLSAADRGKFDPFQDTFFFLYRERGQKKVVEVLANLRSSGGSGPYLDLSEYGIAKFFADEHISNQSGKKTSALRGFRAWEFGSQGVKRLGLKSYNMHPGDWKGRSSAGCATVRNRGGETARNYSYLKYMHAIFSAAFNDAKYIGDKYPSDPYLESDLAHINKNAVFMKKIILH